MEEKLNGRPNGKFRFERREQTLLLVLGDFIAALLALGIALLELSTVSMILSKFGRISGITGAASIYILVQTLSDIAEALKMFSDLDPERTGDALFAMGIALGELAALDVVLGRVNALNGLAGAAG